MATDFTNLLQRHRKGDSEALDGLLALAYDELRQVAARAFNGQAAQHTLQPTAVLHEAWLKLAGQLGNVRDRRHFFALAARAMRQVLVDHAKRRSANKRGGGRRADRLDEDLHGAWAPDDLVALDDSLARLATLNARHARVVELRVFGALTIAEAAAELDVATSTVEADWAMARAWLQRELSA